MSEHQLYYVLIYVILTIFVYYSYKKSSNFNINTVLLLDYAVCAICSLVFYLANNVFETTERAFYNITLVPILFIFGMNMLISYPLLRVKYENIGELIINNKLIDIIKIILTICAFPIFLDSITIIPQLLSTDLGSMISDVHDAQLNKDGNFSAAIGFNALSIQLLRFVTYFQLLTPIILIDNINRGGRKIYTMGLFLCIYIVVLNSILCGSRANVVYELIMIGLSYTLYMGFIQSSLRAKLTRIIISVLSIVGVLVSAMTILRFSYSDPSEAISNMVGYAGEGLLQFSEYCWDLDTHSWGDKCFPYFKELMGMSVKTSSTLSFGDAWSELLDITTWIFYTMVGSFVMDFGVYNTVLIYIIFTFINYWIISRLDTRYLSSLYLLLMEYNVLASSFAYFYYSVGNKVLIMHIVVYILLRTFEKHQTIHNISISKK